MPVAKCDHAAIRHAHPHFSKGRVRSGRVSAMLNVTGAPIATSITKKSAQRVGGRSLPGLRRC